MFGYVLCIGDSESFLKNLFSVSIAESLKVRDDHFSFLEVMRQVEGFMVQNHGTPDLKYEKVRDTVSGA